MGYSENIAVDLRELLERQLGKPLAASATAALWRCPACSHERHGLLMVSADETKCLSGYPCDGGASEWMKQFDESSAELFGLGAPA